MKNKRDKKWIGAAIGLAGTAVNLVTNLIQGNKQKKLEEEQKLQEAKLKAEQEANQTADALSSQYQNTQAVDEFKKQMTFKAGGTIANDRIKHLKQFKCGGRKKQ